MTQSGHKRTQLLNRSIICAVTRAIFADRVVFSWGALVGSWGLQDALFPVDPE
jgi:hypothetical protein